MGQQTLISGIELKTESEMHMNGDQLSRRPIHTMLNCMVMSAVKRRNWLIKDVGIPMAFQEDRCA